MNHIQTFLARQREHRAELAQQFPAGLCWVVSVETLNTRAGTTRGGTLTEVSIDSGARVLAEKTHRLANQEEVAQYLDSQARERWRTSGTDLSAMRARFKANVEAQRGAL